MLYKLYFVSLIAWTTARKQNIILIIVDDLRTTLGCYGDMKAHTPNIDRLATEAAMFTEAFAQQALCAPSRNSMLTSRRPDTLQLYDFYSYWRTAVANFTTLPQHLKNNGYITKSIGKVFHPGISSNNSDDSPYSWTTKPFHPYTNRYKDASVCQTNARTMPAQNLVCPVDVLSMPNKTLPDIEILKEAKRFIKAHRKNTKPFFLAVGFQKPHIPLKYPAKYLKYHPLRKFQVPNPYEWLENVSSIAYNPWIDLRKRADIAALNLTFPWEKIPASFGKLIIQSYYAAVSYVDHLIGVLINQVERMSMRQNTIIILTSDHGWSLGEHALWAKYSNFNVALRVPLIISIPGLTFGKSEWIAHANSTFLECKKILRKNLRNFSSNSAITNATFKLMQDNEFRNCIDRKLQNVQKINVSSTTKFSKTEADLEMINRTDVQFLRTLNLERSAKIRSNQHTKNEYVYEYFEHNTFQFQPTGIIINEITELVDVFPTVAELVNIPIPICPEILQTTCSEGISLVPLMFAKARGKSIPWKKAAFGQYPRPGVQPTMKPNSDEPRLKEITAMGYTLKTRRYRYTAWLPFLSETKKSNWSVIIAEELYDHKFDRNENHNVASFQYYFKIKHNLNTLLRNGWRNVLPKHVII